MMEKQQQQQQQQQLLAKEVFSPSLYKDETWSADLIDKSSLINTIVIISLYKQLQIYS